MTDKFEDDNTSEIVISEERLRKFEAHEERRKKLVEKRKRNFVSENRINDVIAEYLRQKGFHVSQALDKQHGPDIDARSQTNRLLVTIKGFPAGTDKTDPNTQATHYFKDAIFDVVSWRSGNINASLAVGLPDRPVYRSLAKKASWLQQTAPFVFLWVSDAGRVSEQPSLT